MPRLTLSNIDFSIDPKTGVLEATSRDEKLQNKPFKITLSSNTETYKTILNLMKKEKLLKNFDTLLPKTVKVSDPQKLLVPDKDPRTSFFIGETFDNELIELDFQADSHLSISGPAGSGKTTLINTILFHTMNQGQINNYVIDSTFSELYGRLKPRENDRIAENEDDVLKMLKEVLSEMHERHDLLEEKDIYNFFELPDYSSIFVIVDGVNNLIPSNSKNSFGDPKINFIKSALDDISIYGRTVGIFLIVASQKIEKIPFYRNIMGRVSFGKLPPQQMEYVHRKKAHLGPALLENRGRGIISFGNSEPELFQSFFVPFNLRN